MSSPGQALFCSGVDTPSPLFCTEIRHFHDLRNVGVAKFFIRKGLDCRFVTTDNLASESGEKWTVNSEE